MNLYQKLTDEQFRENSRNNGKARRWFKRNGFMPDPNLTYDLHHKDINLRYTDIDRYIQWNIEDLICLEHSEHTKLHNTLMPHDWSATSEERSNKMKKLRSDKDSVFNSDAYRQSISDTVKKLHANPNGPYLDDWRNKISESQKATWTSARKHNYSVRLKEQWKNSESIYNNLEFRKHRSDSHKKVIVVTDGTHILRFKGAVECGLYFGYENVKSAASAINYMIKRKNGIVTSPIAKKQHNPCIGWKIYYER